MTKFLITSSLLNSYQYYIQDEWKSPADSRADFLKTLSREKFEPNLAMQKGLDFEDAVNYFAKNKSDDRPIIKDGGIWDGIEEEKINEIAKELANIVENGLWQQSVKKELKIGNQEFLLYGRTDVIKRDTIYDIKFTSNYELGKFLDSSQHLIYLYCTELPNFQYLISDGKDYWIEDYFNNLEIEDKIKSKINDFMSYLESDKEAKELFLTKWESK